MGDDSGAPQRGYPIRVVSKRTGLTPEVLRVWERRYAVVSPRRAPNGRRYYSDADIHRLQLICRAIRAGHRIGDLSGLAEEELAALIEESAFASPPPPRPAGRGAGNGHLGRALEAIEELSVTDLESILAQASLELPPARMRQEFLVPLLHRVGDLWQEGSLRVVHEHLGSTLVRSALSSLVTNHLPPSAPVLILTTPAGHRHELGAMMASWIAAEEGWRAIFLGPDLPAEEIAAAARQKDARAVGLSLVYPADDPVLPRELNKLRRYLGEDTAVFLGGRAAPAYAAAARKIGASVVTDLEEFRIELRTLRNGTS